jgi:hypothetical protein
MVTRLAFLALAAALSLACKKDNAKPSASALSDAAQAAVARPADAAPVAAVPADAGATADAGSRTAAGPADAGAKSGPVDEKKPTNLKVLPKSWSTAKVNDYMKKQVARGLGVKCEFCHLKDDFASDDNEHKVEARKMISLTDSINKDHFKKKPEVTCFTCHKGKEEVAP